MRIALLQAGHPLTQLLLSRLMLTALMLATIQLPVLLLVKLLMLPRPASLGACCS